MIDRIWQAFNKPYYLVTFLDALIYLAVLALVFVPPFWYLSRRARQDFERKSKEMRERFEKKTGGRF